MFGFFKKKPELVCKDYIWKNENTKYNALMKHLQQCEKSVFVYYFEDTRAEAEKHLNTAHLNFSTESHTFAGKVWLLSANNLLHLSALENRSVFFAEHHPSYSHEQSIKTHLLNNLAVRELIFYTSFEDKLLQMFGSERILQLMEKMGMKDDESIQHSMISTSLERAQQRIDEKIGMYSDTRMRKDWFKVNLVDIETL